MQSASAPCTWPLTNDWVSPASFCSSDSPTQTMGVRPASRAALVFLLTVSSVSAKYWRRSLWPRMTYWASPTSIAALTSPV